MLNDTNIIILPEELTCALCMAAAQLLYWAAFSSRAG
jgi:hypothetical protein